MTIQSTIAKYERNKKYELDSCVYFLTMPNKIKICPVTKGNDNKMITVCFHSFLFCMFGGLV